MRDIFRKGAVLLVVLFMSVSIAQAAVCPHCSYDNQDDYRYCIKCGARLSHAKTSSGHDAVTGATHLAGPKKTLAVVGFENASGLHSYIHLGDDFTAQLSDALIQSGAFTVVSRTELSKIFTEQDLAASGRMARSLTAQKGKTLPAQILVTGKITEFEEEKSSGSQGLSIHGVTIGGNKANAHIAVIVQIIDSTTGEILDSRRVEGSAAASGFSIGYSGSWSLGSSSFKKTPLGKATQIAIDKAVDYISQELAKHPWQGRVVKVSGDLVYVNAGSDRGISSGMQLAVYDQGESLIDPETGINLGSERTKIADISVTEVQPKFSKARIVNASREIKTADLVFER